MTAPTTLQRIACFWKTARAGGKAIVVELRQWDGRPYLDVREHELDAAGRMVPTHRGIAVMLRRIPDLAAAIQKATAKAIDLGLIKSEARNG